MNKRRISLFLILVMITMLVSPAYAKASAYADCWRVGTDGKWFVEGADGKAVTNVWICDDAVSENGKDVWYLLDGEGKLVDAPLIQDSTGNYYSLETEHNGHYGMLRNKSGNYDGIYIEINETHDGSFGRITSSASVSALKAKYGVLKVDTTNARIVFTSAIRKTVSSGSAEETVAEKTSFVIPLQTEDGVYAIGRGRLTVENGGTELTYENTSGKAQKVTITTDAGQKLTVNAPKDDVYHEGAAEGVYILAVAASSYHGNADVFYMELESGHADIGGKVTSLKATPEKNITIDVSKGAEVPEIYVASPSDASKKTEVEINVAGSVNTVKSETGAVALNVDPSVQKVPKLEFVGEEAVKAFEERRKQALEQQGEFTGMVCCGDEEIAVTCPMENDEIQLFRVGFEELMQGKSKTFTEDVVITGDFIKVMFFGCTFKGNVINRGSEQTMVMFYGCTFEGDSHCVFENNGREMTVNDLIPKFVFVEMKPVVTDIEGMNGAVIVTNISEPVLLDDGSGTETVGIKEVEYYVDERKNSLERSIQPYEGQPINILYVNRMNMIGGREGVILGERNMTTGNLSWVADGTGEGEETMLYAYICAGGETITYDATESVPAERLAGAFVIRDKHYASGITVNAPCNEVTFKNCTFDEKVIIKGHYADVTFEGCTLTKGYEIDGESKGAEVTVK